MLLAAIAAVDPELQTTPGVAQAAPDVQPPTLPGPQAANDDDADTAIETIETAAIPKPTIAQDPVLDPGAAIPPKGSAKPDKKANTDKTEPDIAAAPLPAQPQTPIPPQFPIAPMAQAAVQTQAVASNDDDSDAALGITASGATNAAPPASSNAMPAPFAPNAAQPSQTGQAAAPSQLAAVNDEDTDNSDVLNNSAPTDQAKPATQVAEIKFTQARSPVSKAASQPISQPQALAAVDDDVDVVAEPSSLSAVNAPSQPTAQTAPQSNPAETAQASPVPPAPQKPDSKAADKPAPDKIADLLPSGTNSATAGTTDSGQNSNATPTADNGSDSKPAHDAVSATPPAQTDTPLPPVQSGAAAIPQATLAVNIAGPNTSGGLTLSVHVANHDTGSQSSAPSDVTPNIDTLAVSVAARSLGGSKQFEIRLDPPELGRVEVRLSIDASGKTQAHMTADQPQTLELLQKDATNLTRALRDAGLDVSQNGLNFSLKGQGQNGGGQSGNFGGASRGLS